MVYKLDNPTLYFDGKKSILLEQFPDDAWEFYSGAPETTQQEYYKFIPTLYRAVDLRGGAVASMPFHIMKGDDEYDSSASWNNEVGFMPNPKMLLRLVEMSMTIAGRAYLWRERNIAVSKELRYVLPTSIYPIIGETEVEGFKRGNKRYKADDFVYFWPPDPYVELGPAQHYPGQAAANACGVLMNVDKFSMQYFERGAIKAMLLTMKGAPLPAERERLESWWKNVVGGMRNAFGAKVINAEAVTPVVIGEGMKELENVTLTQEKKEDIAEALGIPLSILFSNAANYATSVEDERHFLTKTVIPECEFIASVLNEQVFEPMDMYFEFLPETLDAMQDDEVARADALTKLVSVLNEPMFLLAAQILGYELSKEQLATWNQLQAEKKERAAVVAAQMQPKEEAEPAEEEEGEEEPEINAAEYVKADLEKWKVKSLKRLREGESAAVTFTSEFIPAWRNAEITASLANCTTAEDVRAVFASVNGNGHHDPTVELIQALKDATAAILETNGR